jgi:hypothetical protein
MFNSSKKAVRHLEGIGIPAVTKAAGLVHTKVVAIERVVLDFDEIDGVDRIDEQSLGLYVQ